MPPWQAPFASEKFAPVERRLRGARRFSACWMWVWDAGTNAASIRRRRLRRHRHQRAVPAAGRARGSGARSFTADLTTADLSSLGTFDIDSRQQLSSSCRRRGGRANSRPVAHVLAPEGRVHILELVLPERKSLAWMMARLDRGRYRQAARALARAVRRRLRADSCRTIFLRRQALVDDLLPGAENDREALGRHSGLQRAGSHSRTARASPAGARRHRRRAARSRVRRRWKHR